MAMWRIGRQEKRGEERRIRTRSRGERKMEQPETVNI
jgi:hypothetical protein